MLPDRNQLQQLSQLTHPCVSMYLPTHMAGADTRENAIRFKNRLQDAERQLQALGYDEDSAKDFLQAAYARVEDNDYWQHRQHGLAVFVSPEGMFEYDLPGNPEALTVVAPHVHVKPLIPYFTLDARFFVLAASLNCVRLFEASRYYISEVALPDDTPTSLAEALKFDDPETSLDHYTVSAGGDAVFQGQGAGKDERNTDILRFFQALDNGVRQLLEPQGARIPLVFAGDKGIFPIYQDANHYQGLFADAVTGNPDEHDVKTLHQHAWQVLEPHLNKAFDDAKAQYLQKVGNDAEHASDVLRDVLPAAFDSRIETLFVAQDKHIWGHYDHDQRRADVHDDPQPGDSDLLDVTALQTLLTGGEVHVASQQHLPEQHLVAAVYRF
jgi:hypothetical protein